MFYFLIKPKIDRYTQEAAHYLNRVYVDPEEAKKPRCLVIKSDKGIKYSISKIGYDSDKVSDIMKDYRNSDNFTEISDKLHECLNQSFVECLLSYVEKQGVKDSAIYKAAGIDRRLYSKIISDINYKPSKDTAIALALALKLTVQEANEFLSLAGYTFSHSNKRDVILEFFFKHKTYDIMIINEVLVNLDQKMLKY